MSAPSVPIRRGIYRILICRPNHRLGNTLLLTPLISELEERYQGAEIDIVSEGDIAEDVFKGFFSVKRVFCLPRRGFKHPIAILRTVFRIRRTRYDLIIDPTLRSGFGRALTWFLRGRFKLGFSDRRTRSLTHAAPYAVAGRHMAQRPVNLVRWAARSIPTTSQFYPPLAIHLTQDERAEGATVVAALTARPAREDNGPIIGIFGNATGAKRYPEAWWMDFMATLQGALPQASIIEIVPAHAQSMLREARPGYYSSDIRRMAAVLAGLDLFITADCGVMHLGAATGVPTIGLFKATVLDVYEPYGGRNTGLDTADASGGDTALRVIERFKVTRDNPSLSKVVPRSRRTPAQPVHGAHIGG
jgi:ADP-heptose:LPS heptosyltransferase